MFSSCALFKTQDPKLVCLSGGYSLLLIRLEAAPVLNFES